MTNPFGFGWTVTPVAWSGTLNAGVSFAAFGIPRESCASLVMNSAPMWRQIRVGVGAATPIDAHAAGAPGRAAVIATVTTACAQARTLTLIWTDL